MGLRRRHDDDLQRLAALIELSRAADRYPPHWPTNAATFVASPNELAAYIFEGQDREVVGHVSLHSSTAGRASEVASDATGLEASRLAVVARMVVEPTKRRKGIGRRLLEEAAVKSLALGFQPILDVWSDLGPAIAFYESCGWWRAGEAAIEFRSGCSDRCLHKGRSITSYVFVGPAVHPRS